MNFKPLALLALLTACGPSKYYSVDTYSRGIEQAPVGQSLLAAAPIDDRYRVRLTGGLSTVVATAERTPNGPQLYTPRQSISGGLAVRAGKVELEVVGNGALTAATGNDAPGRGASYGGLRLRGSPGGDRVRLGIAVEAGVRQYAVQHGTSVICEVEPVGESWVRTDDGCWASQTFAQDSELMYSGYLAATLYPTVRVAEGFYIFAGAGLHSAATDFQRSQVYHVFESGPTFEVESEDKPDWSHFVTTIVGLEGELADFLAVLVNVRAAPFGARGLDTVAEAAISLRF